MIIATFVIICSSAMMISILTYRRGDSTYKRHISILAALLCILAGFNIVRVMTYLADIIPISYMELVWFFICTLAIIRNKGNVSFLVYGRHTHESK